MGEDPHVASQLVAPLVKGIQSNNVSACVKHFVFNNHEVNRQTFSANVDERTGRELYTPAFFAAVDAGVGSFMCAFNRVNNTFSCQNEGVLTSLLKKDGGFRGWVVTVSLAALPVGGGVAVAVGVVFPPPVPPVAVAVAVAVGCGLWAVAVAFL